MSSKDGKSGQPPSGDNLQDRLHSLGARLEARKVKDRANAGQPKRDKSGFGAALRLSSEFISAILVGAGLGYFLDRLAGTTPWGMIILLLLGFVAGVINVLRSSGQVANPYDQGWAQGKKEKATPPPSVPDDLYDDEDDDR